MSAEQHPSVDRVTAALLAAGHHTDVRWLQSSARTAAEAAAALGIEVGQIASSLVFTRPGASPGASDAATLPVLVITSGRHRVDTEMVATLLGVPALGRADADFVRAWSGFAIGGVAPVGWQPQPPLESSIPMSEWLTVIVDEALADYDEVWAAAGHPHTVFRTTAAALAAMTGGHLAAVGH